MTPPSYQFPMLGVSSRTLREILSGSLTSLEVRVPVKPGQHVGIYQNTRGRQIRSRAIHGPPSPNAIVLITHVEASTEGKRGTFYVAHWQDAIEIKVPDPDRCFEEIKHDILHTIATFVNSIDPFVSSFALGQLNGISLDETEAFLMLLEEEGNIEISRRLVEHDETPSYWASITPRGRIALSNKIKLRDKIERLARLMARQRRDEPPVEIRESLDRFRSEFPDDSKVAFIMMRLKPEPQLIRIVRAIESTRSSFGIRGFRADTREYNPDLLGNILTYIYGCGFGIAVFDRLLTNEFNPNVSLEIGYMMGLRKHVCLLKDETLQSLHADLTGRLYRRFDANDPTRTIPPQLTKWLKDKGIVSGNDGHS